MLRKGLPVNQSVCRHLHKTANGSSCRPPGQFDLGTYERSLFGAPVLIQPIRQDESGRILIGVFADRREQCVVVGHEGILS